MAKKLIVATLVVLLFGLIWIWVRPVAVFPGIAGPTKASVIQDQKSTPVEDFSAELPSSLAVLLTDPDSNWLSLAHALESFGIPFTFTKDTTEALQHNVVIVYPRVSGKVLSRESLQSLRSFVHGGGTLLAVNVLGGGLNAVFGFKDAIPSRDRYQVTFLQRVSTLLSLDGTRETVFQLGHPDKGEPIGSHGYTFPSAPPLACFEDGTGAIIGRDFERGHAYAFGFDIGQLIHTGYTNRDESIGRDYVNNYEPTIDLILRLIRAVYLRDEPEAVLLGTVPYGKELTILITHDIDYRHSVQNAVAYAELEEQHGIRATYFLQTKYVRDYNDKIFFDPAHTTYINRLVRLGMEIGSHSVAHSRQFSQFPIGTGREAYPSYRPFVRNKKKTSGGSILGELRVSKFLIEQCTDVDSVVSFRPGVLSNPYSMPQALEAAGYRFSSSVTANNSLTHLPFRLSWGRLGQSETPIFEFPVTIEDEEAPPMNQRLEQALDLAEKIATYGGLYNVLIHPNVLDEKMRFLNGFLKEWKGRAWFGTVKDFGHWWAVRNATQMTSEVRGRHRSLTLELPATIDGLTLTVPVPWKMISAEPETTSVKQTGTTIVIEKAQDTIKIIFDVKRT